MKLWFWALSLRRIQFRKLVTLRKGDVIFFFRGNASSAISHNISFISPSNNKVYAAPSCVTSCLAWCQLGWALLDCDWSAEPVLASHWSRARVGPAAVASVRPGQSPESWGRDTLTLCQWEGTCDIKCDPEARAATWLQSGHVDDSRHVRENQQHYSRRGLQSGGQTYPGIRNTQNIRS